jgi:4-amino-4-deoxy-L-arabinose transferase-like glycosyltransferase
MKDFIKKYWSTILLIFILVLGAYLRLYMIRNYMTFLGDEGRDVLIVKRMIVDHKFTLLGPTASVGGFFLGPIYYYFMMPFLWASALDPVGPAIGVALVGVATIFLVFYAGKKFFGNFAGLFSASVYALSPLVIAYSRSSWNPNIVPFFALALIYLLWKLIVKPHRATPFAIGVILGIGIQLHYLFLFLFVLVGIWYLIHVRRIPFWKTVLETGLGFIIGILPFLAFEIRHGFANTQTIIQFLMTGKDTGFSAGSFFNTITDVSFRSFGRLVFRIPQKDVFQNYSSGYITSLFVCIKSALYVSILLFCSILLYSNSRIRHYIHTYIDPEMIRGKLSVPRNTLTAIILLSLWFIVTVGLFGLYRKAIYDYYFGIFFPLPFLLIGYSVSKLFEVKWGRYVAIILWVSLLIFNWQGRPFIYEPNNQIEQVKKIASVAFEKTDGKPFNFALIADGNSDHGYRYFFEIWNSPPVTIENTQIDPDRRTVTDQLIVICETIDCQPLGNSLWEVAGFGRAEIVGQWEVPFVKIYKLVHYKESVK